MGRLKTTLACVAMLTVISLNVAGCSSFWQKTAAVSGEVNAATATQPVDPTAQAQPVIGAIRPIIAAAGQAYPPLDLIISALGAISGIVYGLATKVKSSATVKSHQNALTELNSLLPPTANLTPATRKLVHAAQST